MIDLSAKEFAIIRRLAREHFSQGTQIWVYGSRVDGTCHDTSDLDIVIHPAEHLSSSDATGELLGFKEALQESTIPILVDAFLWEDLPEHFRERIKQCYEVFGFEGLDYGG